MESDLKNKHWSEILADKVLAEKKQPFVISGGMTTSGSPHAGTLCEMLYPSIIYKQLINKGAKAKFHFVGDILDAFDGVPADLAKFTDQLTPHLGKPLCFVPDPFGDHASYGDHFLAESAELAEKFGVNPEIHRANDLYASGAFDKYGELFLAREEEAKLIVAESSLKPIEEMAKWSSLMPICETCGKIATTQVTEHGKDWYKYTCNKNAKYTQGCGHIGENKLSEHRWKLNWRLHWPAWMDYFKTSIEGAGKDHHTRGGSWDTAVAVFEKLFKKPTPLGFKFGFIMFQGKKYSKSKGIGLDLKQLIEIIPPPVLSYSLVKPDLQEDKDLDPSGTKLMTLFDDLQRLANETTTDSRADQKKLMAYSLAVSQLPWSAPFADVLMYYQLYKSWEKVGELLNDKAGVHYLSPYIEAWLAKGLVPQDYSFSLKPTKITKHLTAVHEFARGLKKGQKAIDIHHAVFDVAKAHKIAPEELFATLYVALLGQEKGPKMGRLVEAIGVEKVKELLSS